MPLGSEPAIPDTGAEYLLHVTVFRIRRLPSGAAMPAFYADLRRSVVAGRRRGRSSGLIGGAPSPGESA
jgi:hypothetical protein